MELVNSSLLNLRFKLQTTQLKIFNFFRRCFFEQSTLPYDILPNDVWLVILSNLSVKDVHQFMSVNHSFNRIGKTESLWKYIYSRDFDDMENSSEVDKWNQYYHKKLQEMGDTKKKIFWNSLEGLREILFGSFVISVFTGILLKSISCWKRLYFFSFGSLSLVIALSEYLSNAKKLIVSEQIMLRQYRSQIEFYENASIMTLAVSSLALFSSLFIFTTHKLCTNASIGDQLVLSTYVIGTSYLVSQRTLTPIVPFMLFTAVTKISADSLYKFILRYR